ncbi:HD domain-containing protein [Undibacterium sp. CY18W]|uniref:HD domain-containing protein n=1 Tax=Undibacterium hunanense TaxID=2762292 RepID=A0ABR6ZSE6_9BURK|nr:HD domain-containing phosphohydrolase [Undibacterium hunanense]MBC3918744.1 HD domain-containing protein [Undibacterium hunanense]
MNTPHGADTFTCPEFLAMERTIIDDFVDCTREACEEAEVCVKELNNGGGTAYIHRLFRAMHSLKGNCQMVGLGPFTDLLHRIEEIVARVRANQDPYFRELGEFLLLANDEVEDLLNDLIAHGFTSDIRRKKLFDLCDALQKNSAHGFQPQHFKDAIALLDGKAESNDTVSKPQKVVLELPADMELMRKFAAHIDNLSIYRKNRTDQVAQLTESLNEALNFLVDAEQLKVASLMHDVGMSFIPHSIFNKEGVLSKEEVKKIQEHVVTSSQLLLRFGGWDEAARMVLDHHERFDGSGYPNGLQGEQIHPGARMLSIVDTFCSVTNERSDRSYKRSLLSAISEINANSDSQFDPQMVEVFNSVVRKLIAKQ